MNYETLNRLNDFIADCKAEFADKDATIADLLDKLSKAEQSIDEGCVGCAGPCKVVDVSANLQKELDATRSMYRSASDERSKQRKIIEDMRIELHDLKMHRQGKIIEDFKTIETRETDRLHKLIEDYKETIHIDRTNRAAEKELINRKFSEDLRKMNATIDELKDKNSNDLNELYELDKMECDNLKAEIYELKHLIDCSDDTRAYLENITKQQKNVVSGLMHANVGLEAELSARKGDSAVLMKVVSVLKTWNECHRTNRSVLDELSDIVKDYLGAKEVSPETPIEEDQDIAIVFTYGEIL